MKNLVIENQFGQVVRYLKTDTQKFYLIHRMDTQRIENVSDLTVLEEKEIPFQILKEIDLQFLTPEGYDFHNGNRLKLVDEVNEISLNLRPQEESDENLKKAFKYVAIANVIFLIFIFALSQFWGPSEENEMRVVKIEPRPQSPRQIPRPTVAPARQKIPKNVKVAQVAKKQIKIPTKNLRPTSKPLRKKMVALNQMGVAGVLGTLGHKSGGLKVEALQTSHGPGLGGNAGSGGMQSTFYGKGLVGASLGAGNKINGAGGIGTRGKGGGKAGYGNLSLVGSSGAYLQPIQEDALVEGGLDRDEIAAVIHRHLGQIRFCYEQGLQTKPELSGRVAVKFVIAGSGFVSLANIANTSLRSQSVEGCIVTRLKSWKFPEPRGGVNVRVTYPFVLKRVSQS